MIYIGYEKEREKKKRQNTAHLCTDQRECKEPEPNDTQ